jgi:hypothetical protein
MSLQGRVKRLALSHLVRGTGVPPVNLEQDARYDLRFNFPPIKTPMAPTMGKVRGTHGGSFAFCIASNIGTSPVRTASALGTINDGTASSSPNTNTTAASAIGAFPPFAIAAQMCTRKLIVRLAFFKPAKRVRT